MHATVKDEKFLPRSLINVKNIDHFSVCSFSVPWMFALNEYL